MAERFLEKQAATRKAAASSAHWEASFRFGGPACADAPKHRRQKSGWDQRNSGCNRKNRKDALAAGRRRACEKLGMPVANHRTRLIHRRRSLYLSQHHHGSRNRDRRSRMHHDAQRAMVGIALQHMRVRHLHHGQQRHQEKTNHRRRRQSACLATAISADWCLRSCQPMTPASRITKLDALTRMKVSIGLIMKLDRLRRT